MNSAGIHEYAIGALWDGEGGREGESAFALNNSTSNISCELESAVDFERPSAPA